MDMLNLERAFVRELVKHRCGLNSLKLLGYLRKWKASQLPGRSPMTDRQPWLTFQATATLTKSLWPGCAVFEFGGGGSTLYFLDQGANVVTVEHDAQWFDLLVRSVREGGQTANWTGLKKTPVPIGPDANSDPADPDAYASEGEPSSRYYFREYAESIDAFADCHFDIVVIDGRSRPSCVKHSVRKVKLGGLLLLDNTERTYYLTPKTQQHLSGFLQVLDKFGPSPGLGWFTKTTVWRRTV